MDLQWKGFRIDLKSFYEWLIVNVPNANGIIAFDEYMTIPSHSVFSQEEKDLINSYYNNLNEEDELFKISKPKLIQDKLLELKNNMILKSYDELNIIERKILLGMELSSEELDSLI